MAYVIKVKRGDWKKSKLYGGKGRVVINRIHAVMYEHPYETVRDFCNELECDNPGVTFTPEVW